MQDYQKEYCFFLLPIQNGIRIKKLMLITKTNSKREFLRLVIEKKYKGKVQLTSLRLSGLKYSGMQRRSLELKKGRLI